MITTKTKRDEHQVGGHNGDVDELHRLHEERAEAGPLEDALGDDGEGDDAAELQAGDGHHRHHGVLERVAELDGAFRHAAGAGELHVVGAHDLEHFRAARGA